MIENMGAIRLINGKLWANIIKNPELTIVLLCCEANSSALFMGI
jgi:hypothetical protein